MRERGRRPLRLQLRDLGKGYGGALFCKFRVMNIKEFHTEKSRKCSLASSRTRAGFDVHLTHSRSLSLQHASAQVNGYMLTLLFFIDRDGQVI